MCRENPRRPGILVEEICYQDQMVCPLYGRFVPKSFRSGYLAP